MIHRIGPLFVTINLLCSDNLTHVLSMLLTWSTHECKIECKLYSYCTPIMIDVLSKQQISLDILWSILWQATSTKLSQCSVIGSFAPHIENVTKYAKKALKQQRNTKQMKLQIDTNGLAGKYRGGTVRNNKS